MGMGGNGNTDCVPPHLYTVSQLHRQNVNGNVHFICFQYCLYLAGYVAMYVAGPAHSGLMNHSITSNAGGLPLANGSIDSSCCCFYIFVIFATMFMVNKDVYYQKPLL